mmetsp:Transcript_2305/g.5829  ORF Transcript_2305/g.5829 Transcript_2305/m.5829 type:complete len:301 (+) Transcript_2305:1052-1954(+)
MHGPLRGGGCWCGHGHRHGGRDAAWRGDAWRPTHGRGHRHGHRGRCGRRRGGERGDDGGAVQLRQARDDALALRADEGNVVLEHRLLHRVHGDPQLAHGLRVLGVVGDGRELVDAQVHRLAQHGDRGRARVGLADQPLNGLHRALQLHAVQRHQVGKRLGLQQDVVPRRVNGALLGHVAQHLLDDLALELEVRLLVRELVHQQAQVGAQPGVILDVLRIEHNLLVCLHQLSDSCAAIPAICRACQDGHKCFCHLINRPRHHKLLNQRFHLFLRCLWHCSSWRNRRSWGKPRGGDLNMICN